MIKKRLYITIFVSALLHLLVFTIWWQGQSIVVVSSIMHGSPLNVSISQPKKSSQAKTNPDTSHQQQENLPANKPVGQTIQSLQSKLATRSEYKVSELTKETKEKTQHTKDQPTLEQEQDYALLNNNMIHYLSSEFKLRFKYPVLARKRGWQGEVLLGLDINRHGKIAYVVIQRSSGYKILDRNAVRTFESIGEISPELKTALAKGHQLSIPVVYKLTGG